MGPFLWLNCQRKETVVEGSLDKCEQLTVMDLELHLAGGCMYCLVCIGCRGCSLVFLLPWSYLTWQYLSQDSLSVCREHFAEVFCPCCVFLKDLILQKCKAVKCSVTEGTDSYLSFTHARARAHTRTHTHTEDCWQHVFKVKRRTTLTAALCVYSVCTAAGTGGKLMT